VSEPFKNEDLTTMRDLGNYYRDDSPGRINLYSILIRAQVRRRLCEILYPVMTDVLKHGEPYDGFAPKYINFTEPPPIHTVTRGVIRNPGRDVKDTQRTTAEDVTDSHNYLPDLNIVFGDDVIEKQQITNFNWMSNSSLTVSYYRHTYVNPEYNPETGVLVSPEKGFVDDKGQMSRLSYASLFEGKTTDADVLFSKNFLIEDLEAACLMFDLEIQRKTQLIPFVSDIQLENVSFTIPADEMYGSVEMEYNVNYHTDYKCLERK